MSHFLPNRRSFKVDVTTTVIDYHRRDLSCESEISFILSRSDPIFTISLFETFNCIVVFSIACVPSYMTKLTQLPLLAIPHRFIYTVARKNAAASYENREKREMIIVPEYRHTDIRVPYLYSRENYKLRTREIYDQCKIREKKKQISEAKERNIYM